jgi:hypothetical protein
MHPFAPGALLAVLFVAAFSDGGLGGDFGLTGRYVGETESSLLLVLQEGKDGVVTGTLSGEAMGMTLQGHRAKEMLTGTLSVEGFSQDFTARVEGNRIVVTIAMAGEVEQMAFQRQADAPAKAPAPTGPRKVVINGVTLDEKELARVEKEYRIRIPEADYWYDPVLGAWGARNGPTMGFILPGLRLGGPLPADASGKGTSIFVNGRELHPLDVMALQQVTGPIPPGRYFITAQGLAGYEGGPPLWNLLAMAGSPSGGDSNTWQSRLTGASGFSDGTTGAVFLPNGGIVSTGN